MPWLAQGPLDRVKVSLLDGFANSLAELARHIKRLEGKDVAPAAVGLWLRKGTHATVGCLQVGRTLRELTAPGDTVFFVLVAFASARPPLARVRVGIGQRLTKLISFPSLFVGRISLASSEPM